MNSPTERDMQSPIGSLGAAFEFAVRQREFEINQLTQRNNFFMIFQGVMIAGLIQSQGTAAAVVSFSVCVIGFVVSLFQIGMAAGSKFWQMRWERAAKTTEIWLLDALKHQGRVNSFFTADGRHLTHAEINNLQEINKTKERTDDPLTFNVGANTDATREELTQEDPSLGRQFNNWLILRKTSVSRVPILVGVALAFFWLFLVTFTVSIEASWWPHFDWLPKVRLVQFKP